MGPKPHNASQDKTSLSDPPHVWECNIPVCSCRDNPAETENLPHGYGGTVCLGGPPCHPPQHPSRLGWCPVPCLRNSGDFCGGAGVGGSQEPLGSCDEEGCWVSVLPFLPLLPVDFPPTSCLLGHHRFPAPPCSAAPLPLAHGVSHRLAAPSAPRGSLPALPEVTADPRGTGYFQVWNLTPRTCVSTSGLGERGWVTGANGWAPSSGL